MPLDRLLAERDRSGGRAGEQSRKETHSRRKSLSSYCQPVSPDGDIVHRVGPTRPGRHFGCAKSLELAEVRVPTAAILEGSLR